jgi:hypothetical protein
MKSVLFRETGRLNALGQPEREPVFLTPRHTAGKSLFRAGDIQNGLDQRLNAAGDSFENATGYQIAIDTMTYIKQQESQQSYYELLGKTPRDFVPIVVGEGAWAQSILTRRTYSNAGDFESGLVQQGADNTRAASAKASMDSVNYPTFLWENSVNYSLMEIEQAMRDSQWDAVAAKHRSRMKMFQLGIQAITFLGTKSKNMEGLLINTASPVNTSRITAPINGLLAANFLTFVANLINDYFVSSNSTKLPNRFVIPMSDWLGLTTLVPGSAGTFPVPMIDYLEMAFKKLCGPDFQISGNAYCDAANNNTLRSLNKNVYALYRYDAEAFRMDIPVDFTVTQPGTYDNFHFQDTGYAQLTGLQFFKPLETLLFQY